MDAWITPDAPEEERQILVGGKVNVESLILLDIRPCAGESDPEIVTGVWDFKRINLCYARHLKILDDRPSETLRNEAWLRLCCTGRRRSARLGWKR